jgi:hypothetical protein
MLHLLVLASLVTVQQGLVVSPTSSRVDSLDTRRLAEDSLRNGFRAPRAASLQFAVDHEGRQLVMGESYKASFGPEGATFVPYFGSDAPRSYPVRFVLDAATQGGEPVTLATPAVERNGERFVLDQGALRSEYVASLAGLEQLFFIEAPLGAGDLVLDVALESELVPRPNGAGWLLAGEHGAVSYGAAFALDAEGRRLDLVTEFTGDGFRFVLPAAFLADASWPIAVDPWIATFNVDGDPKDQLEVDVAYDPTTGEYLVVFEEVFAAGDSDIKTWSVDTNGTVVPGSDRYIDFTFVNRTRPRVALTMSHRNFLVVYVEGPAAGPRRIGACPRNADSDTIGAHFLVDENSAVDRLEADVCGDSYAASPLSAHYTVVWRRFWNGGDSDIVARVVNEDGSFVTGEILITNFVNVSDEQPSISKCLSPATDHSLVVWRRLVLPGSYTVMAAMLDFGGTLTTAEYNLSGAGSGNYSHPQVSSLSYSTLPAFPSSLTYVACWEHDHGPQSNIEAVVVAAFENPPAVSAVVDVSLIEHVDVLLDQVRPDVASLGDRWVITQSAVFPGFTDYIPRATTLNIVGQSLGISERFVALTGAIEEALTPKVASRHEAGEVNHLGLLTAWIQQVTFGQPGDVFGAVHAGGNPNTCAAQYSLCYGEPNSTSPHRRAFLMVEGDFSTTGTKRLVASGMTYNAFGYFLASLNVQIGITPPGSIGRLCLGSAIGRYSNSILNTGFGGLFALDIAPTAISQPTGPVAAFAGQTWYFQAWHRDLTPAGLPSSNFTNAVGLPFQ